MARGLGLVVWFSLRVWEVVGSIPAGPLSRTLLYFFGRRGRVVKAADSKSASARSVGSNPAVVAINISSYSSVGRASDWRSEGHVFNSRWGHLFVTWGETKRENTSHMYCASLVFFFLFFSSRIDMIFPELPFSRVNKKKEKKDSHDIEGGEKEKEVLQMQINKKRNVYSDRSEIWTHASEETTTSM